MTYYCDRNARKTVAQLYRNSDDPDDNPSSDVQVNGFHTKFVYFLQFFLSLIAIGCLTTLIIRLCLKRTYSSPHIRWLLLSFFVAMMGANFGCY